MKYGLLSGMLWGLDTVVLGIALMMAPLLGGRDASLASAFLHDFACAVLLFIYMAKLGRLRDVKAALKTKSGRVIMLAALLGGPIGMSGYLVAINNIGAGYTAIISAFYPAIGSLLAVFVLKERMSVKQVISLIIALAAVMVMGWNSATGDAEGNALIGIIGALTCVFGWGAEAVILAWGMQDDAVDNKVALQIRETTSALIYGFVVLPFTGGATLAWDTFVTPTNGVIVLAALAGVCSYLFYYKAINCIGAARAMAANISYSAWAVIFSLVLMSVVPGSIEIACCIVIMIGTVLSSASDWTELAQK